MPENLTPTIVFFDGYCHLCNGFIDWLVQKDTKHVLNYAPLQGTTAEKYLNESQRSNLESVIVVTNDKAVLTQSAAVLHCLSLLPWPWKAFWIFTLVPGFLRNLVYSVIAKNRYSWFGKRDVCRLPTTDEKKYLLP